MRWISNELGRVTQFMNPDEARPIGGIYVPELIRLVGERYGFSELPTTEDARKGGARFRNGRLIAGTRKIVVQEIGIFSDGISVGAQDTDNAEFVLDDAISWARHTLGLRPDLSPKPKRYENSAVIEFEQPIERGLTTFTALQKALQETLSNLYGFGSLMEPARLHFSVDPTRREFPLTDFTIERRINMPYSQNRFFSSAPVRTEMHVDLLQALEDALAKVKT